MTTRRAILLVEDNEDDVFLMKRALKSAGITNPLQVVEDGQRAVDYLAGKGQFSDREKYPFPAIMFLDLKLPMKHGKGNAKNRRQAVAIGLSEARREGIKVKGQPRSKRQATKSSRMISAKRTTSKKKK